jgi:hypothetical protein
MYPIIVSVSDYKSLFINQNRINFNNNNDLFFRFDNYTSTVVVDNITVSLGLWDTVIFNSILKKELNNQY